MQRALNQFVLKQVIIFLCKFYIIILGSENANEEDDSLTPRHELETGIYHFLFISRVGKSN